MKSKYITLIMLFVFLTFKTFSMNLENSQDINLSKNFYLLMSEINKEISYNCKSFNNVNSYLLDIIQVLKNIDTEKDSLENLTKFFLELTNSINLLLTHTINRVYDNDHWYEKERSEKFLIYTTNPEDFCHLSLEELTNKLIQYFDKIKTETNIAATYFNEEFNEGDLIYSLQKKFALVIQNVTAINMFSKMVTNLIELNKKIEELKKSEDYELKVDLSNMRLNDLGFNYFLDNLSDNTKEKITYLNIYNNDIEHLDLSDLINLKGLDYRKNRIKHTKGLPKNYAGDKQKRD
ncbi:hypothetical protein KJ644_03375 [Candidatus Dependentiae bacterium]|nr:hypothetical protein [Candidatus Dependentiae bacterium]MBU4387487.1 hypothetical protein [Candidatus Dependentiae bacterium]MCG2756136.1 hypothetical protein [Candidatus Dependentiae bacterium]